MAIPEMEMEEMLSREKAKAELVKLGYNVSNLKPEEHLRVLSLEHLILAFDAGISARFRPPLDSDGSER